MRIVKPEDKELTDPNQTMSRRARIRAALEARFAPQSLEVIDESSLHAGHAGARPEGETHFRVRMRAAELTGLSRVARQRAVNDALAGEFSTGLHALALELS
jgi:BolA protein